MHVDLGEGDQDPGAGVVGMVQEVDLVGRQLDRCVGDKDEGVGHRQEPEESRRRPAPAPPRTGRIDEAHAGSEDRRGQADLDHVDGSVRPITGEDLSQGVDVDAFGGRRLTFAPSHTRRRAVGVVEDCHRGRSGLGSNGQQILVEDGVDEAGLALLELAHDGHHRRRPGDSDLGQLHPLGQILAAVAPAHGGGLVQELLDRRRWLCHVTSHIRPPGKLPTSTHPDRGTR